MSKYKKLQWLTIVCIGNLFAICAKANIDSEKKAELDENRAQYTQAFIQEDFKKLISLYTSDTRLMGEANPTIFGRDNVELYFGAFFERFEVKLFEKTPHELIDMGTSIMESGAFTITMLNTKGEKRVLKGHYANLWQQAENKKWKINADTWNFNKWIEFKEELVFDAVPSVITAMGPRQALDSPNAIELAAYANLNRDAILQEDARLISNMYSKDARLYPNYHEAVVGRDAIYAYWQGHVTELPYFDSVQNRTDKIEIHGAYIVQYASHIAVYRTDTASGVSTGKHLRVWQRDVDGVLKTRFSFSAYDE